jgi:hypothetical protein
MSLRIGAFRGNERSDSIKGLELTNCLNGYHLLKGWLKGHALMGRRVPTGVASTGWTPRYGHCSAVLSSPAPAVAWIAVRE